MLMFIKIWNTWVRKNRKIKLILNQMNRNWKSRFPQIWISKRIFHSQEKEMLNQSKFGLTISFDSKEHRKIEFWSMHLKNCLNHYDMIFNKWWLLLTTNFLVFFQMTYSSMRSIWLVNFIFCFQDFYFFLI
jgi:hypothetical protein